MPGGFDFLQDGKLPSNTHCVLIDDIVNSGGTLCEAFHELKSMGAQKVSAYVTHGMFPNASYTKIMNVGFERFWFTNSIGSRNFLNGSGPFRVIDISSLYLENRNNNFYYSYFIGSESAVKLKGTTQALIEYRGEESRFKMVQSYKCSSSVDDQPLSYQEIYNGAVNRANGYKNTSTYTIGIENGIIQEGDLYYDIGCIVLLDRYSGELFVNWTEKVPVPTSFMTTFFNENKVVRKYKTVGQVIHNDVPTLPSDNWHSLTSRNNVDRVHLIKECLVKLLHEKDKFLY